MASLNTTSSASSSSSSSSSSSISNITSQSQANFNTNQFYRLKVEDALSYLDQVKFQFEKQPNVYNHFLDIMKEFKSQTIDTPGVISRVSNLFRGHTDLIEGFNTFLPSGYKIEVHANDSVHYIAPNSSMSNLVQPISTPVAVLSSNTFLPANNQNIRTVQQLTQPTHATSIQATLLNLTSATASNPSLNLIKTEPIKVEPLILTPIPANNTATTNQQIGFKGVQQQTNPQLSSLKILPKPNNVTTNASSSTPQITIAQPVNLTHTGLLSTTPPLPNTIPTPAQTVSQPSPIPQAQQQATSASQANNQASQIANQSQVEFGHAINYVNKIKSRFINQPDIYKSFLEILHTYQKQQKNLKEVAFSKVI